VNRPSHQIGWEREVSAMNRRVVATSFSPQLLQDIIERALDCIPVFVEEIRRRVVEPKARAAAE